VSNASAIETNKSIRFCIRSYIAFVLAPEAPIIEWLAKLDNWTRNSPGFFVGKPVVLDLSAVKLGQGGIAHLLEQLTERRIRVIGLEGADSSQMSPSLPPLLTGGRPATEKQSAGNSKQDAATPAQEPVQEEPTSLVIDTPIRSGQTVIFPHGDVTVLGSVASGSEIVAGGSIHIYGTLRGRALAGSKGDTSARIFCRKNEAELLAINGYYRTAEELDDVRRQPVQSWLEDGVLMVAPME
jgi:septum site-determining protein MinC